MQHASRACAMRSCAASVEGRGVFMLTLVSAAASGVYSRARVRTDEVASQASGLELYSK